ncbi:hypothetical protein ACIQJT_21345 [Streptomyces sp. NPDC091972]
MSERIGVRRSIKSFISNVFNRPFLGLLFTLVLIVAIWVGLQLVLPALT